MIAVRGTDVFVGGYFDAAGGVTAIHHIAKWDTTNNTWNGLGNIPTDGFGSVWAIALTETDVYVGGNFNFSYYYPGSSFLSMTSAGGTARVGGISGPGS